MVISESEELLNNVIPYDFVYFSDSVRKPIYRTITIKPRDKDYVVKKKMTDIEMEKGDGFVTQNLSGGKYIKGSLLSSIWLRSLVGSSDMVVFEGLVKEYYRFLFEYFTTREDPNDTFDLLPFNIILDDTGLYRVIDKEWIINSEMPAEYVLFRALLWFSWNNKTLRNSIYKKKDITNIIEFIEYVFSLFSFPLRQELDQFIEFEERVQREVVFKKRPNSVRSMLMEPF
jgi:hypothetical protein